MIYKWVITVTSYNDDGSSCDKSFMITEKDLRSLSGREILKIQYFAGRAYEEVREAVEGKTNE